jgi:predicted transcriptional regulator
VREVLLRELDGRQARPADETLLAEVLALRTILLNAFYMLAEREKLTAEELQSFIDRADATKVHKAIEKLAAKPSS